jgi:hypothetical protein
MDHYSLISSSFTVNNKKDTMEGNRHIVSGTFNGTLFNSYGRDTLRIVEGVFDATLQ